MSGVVRKLKVNKRYASSVCSWCGDALAVGEDGAVCEACESPHHAQCWEERRGCAFSSCVNAPLSELGPIPEQKRQPNPNEKWCPYCGKIIHLKADSCPYCNEIVSADGLYHGEKTLSREARHALLFSVIGFFFAGFILGPVAFMMGRDAKKHIANDPRLRGRGMAIAAQVIGMADVVLAIAAAIYWIRWLMK
jgi:hypothetical protein